MPVAKVMLGKTKQLTYGALLASIGYGGILFAYSLGTSRIFFMTLASIIVFLSFKAVSWQTGVLVHLAITGLTVARPGLGTAMIFGVVVGLYPVLFWYLATKAKFQQNIYNYLLAHLGIALSGQIVFWLFSELILSQLTLSIWLPSVLWHLGFLVGLQMYLVLLDLLYRRSWFYWQNLIAPYFDARGRGSV